MTFTDQIIAGIRSHTGLHYVPSFNDLNSGASDDLEDLELHPDQNRFNEPRAPSTTEPRKSNKVDDLPAMTSSVGDIHKVNRSPVSPNAGRADWVYDNVRAGRAAPSVWQYIVQSQGKTRMPTFSELNPNPDGTIGAAQLQQHMNVTAAQARAMISEADRNADSRLSRDEYADILNEVSA